MEKQNNDSQDTRILDDRTDGGRMIIAIYNQESDIEKLIDMREVACFISRPRQSTGEDTDDIIVEIHLKSGTIICAGYDDKISKAITEWEEYVLHSYNYEMNRR